MKKIHLASCISTQDYLKKNFDELSLQNEHDILVSTKKQIAGYGRFNHQWHFYQYSLAFSLTLTPNPKLTLTSLEIGLLLTDFFLTKFNVDLYLKWPNDLVDKEKNKCGGILINYISPKKLIVGIGINLIKGSKDKMTNNYKLPMGFAIKEKAEFFFHTYKNYQDNYSSRIPIEIYNFILAHRKNEEEIIQQWNDKCIHINKNVEIIDNNISCEGIFQGIGSDGQALIFDSIDKRLANIYSGHLYFKSI